jgi:oligoribonuclease NrnB/cAMP/cGMP phosphodiesterase (DHH superfamily)
MEGFDYDVIIAHGPSCNDGATAAWSVWRSLPVSYTEELARFGGMYAMSTVDKTTIQVNGETVHPNSMRGAIRMQEMGFPVVFVFVQPGEVILQLLTEGKRVLLLDLDLGANLLSCIRHSKHVTLIDHHDSTLHTLGKHSNLLFGELASKVSLIINTNKSESAASLTWRQFQTAVVPPFVNIVRMADNWQWNEVPDLCAREVTKALRFERKFNSFETIEKTYENWDIMFPMYITRGEMLLGFETAMVNQVAKQCEIGMIKTKDGKEYTVAYTQANIVHSEVGAAMRKFALARFKITVDFCATWKYSSHHNIISVSLRDPTPDIDLSVVARSIPGAEGEGGGHKEAASFAFIGLQNFHNMIHKPYGK